MCKQRDCPVEAATTVNSRNRNGASFVVLSSRRAFSVSNRVDAEVQRLNFNSNAAIRLTRKFANFFEYIFGGQTDPF